MHNVIEGAVWSASRSHDALQKVLYVDESGYA